MGGTESLQKKMQQLKELQAKIEQINSTLNNITNSTMEKLKSGAECQGLLDIAKTIRAESSIEMSEKEKNYIEGIAKELRDTVTFIENSIKTHVTFDKVREHCKNKISQINNSFTQLENFINEGMARGISARSNEDAFNRGRRKHSKL